MFAVRAPTPVINVINDVNVGYFNLPGAIDDALDNMGASLLGMTVFTGGRRFQRVRVIARS